MPQMRKHTLLYRTIMLKYETKPYRSVLCSPPTPFSEKKYIHVKARKLSGKKVKIVVKFRIYAKHVKGKKLTKTNTKEIIL